MGRGSSWVSPSSGLGWQILHSQATPVKVVADADASIPQSAQFSSSLVLVLPLQVLHYLGLVVLEGENDVDQCTDYLDESDIRFGECTYAR